MKFKNLHCHPLDISIFKNNAFYKAKTENDVLESDLFAISCDNCDKIHYDFNSEYMLFKNGIKNASLFCNKISKNKYFLNCTIFERFEFNNYLLLGTKNEIISYIYQSFNSLKNKYDDIKYTNKDNERSIDQMKKVLNKEKSEKEEMMNALDKIKKEKNVLNEELKKEKSLTSELNIKINKLNLEQNYLKNEVNKLSLNLNDEKKKNIVLNTKLDNISKENNENIKKVLEQVENEKKINKNLGSKIADLEKNDKLKTLKNEELSGTIKEKEKIIKDLLNNNKNLGDNVDKLKMDLIIKENTIKKVNDSLNKEKKNNQNITRDLNSEKEKNKNLNVKLDNIAIKNNENVCKVLQQLDNEKKKNENFEIKYSEIVKQEKIKYQEKKKLESQLKQKEEELKNIEKNIPKNGLRFQSDCKAGEYDIILDIDSIISLMKDGWKVIYNQKGGKESYLKKKEEETVVVGVIGNKNMGKTYFLEKLSRYDIPKGFNVKTIGLSVRYGTSPAHNVAILDSAGQETPLLKMESSNNKEEFIPLEKLEIEDKNLEEEIKENIEKEKNANEQKKKNEESEDEKNNEFERYSRDKLITEFFLQKFILWKSDIVILVIGNISLTEQKLLYTIKQEVKNLDKNKQIFVIHNLKEYTTEEQVKDYIEKTLKKLCKIEIEEKEQLNILEDNNFDNTKFFNKFYIEKNENVSHFILVNEFSEKASYYNYPTIRHIQKEIEVIKRRSNFSIIDDCKKFLVMIAEEIMEESIKKENLFTEEGENYDKIILKNTNEINLKSYAINEVGFTFRNDSDEPKYSCYVDTPENKLYVHIELPGGGKNIIKNIEIKQGFNLLTFEGEKFGDKILDEEEKNETKKFNKICNKRKTNKFKIHIEIPTALLTIIPENPTQPHKAGKFIKEEKYGKGILSVVYNVIIQNIKRDKNDEDSTDF